MLLFRFQEGVSNHENQCVPETNDQLKYRQCSQVSTGLSGDGKPKPLALAPPWLQGVNWEHKSTEQSLSDFSQLNVS